MRGFLVISTICAASALGLQGCKLSRNAQVAEEAGASLSGDELGASDLSILVPLQSSNITRPEQSAFQKAGSGLCNAFTLDTGAKDDPIMSEDLWQDWARGVLQAVQPLPPDSAAIWQQGKAPDQATKAAYRDRIASAPPLAGVCPAAIGAELLKPNAGLLRQTGSNVAAYNRLAVGACNYQAWRVVSARFEVCSFRAKVLADQPDALNAAHGPGGLPQDACGGAELRIVAEPFYRRDTLKNGVDDLVTADMALHLFYKIDDPAAFIADLRKLRKVSRSVLSGKNASGADGVWYSDQKDLLLPHPGLREEMACTASDPVGQVGQEWKNLLSNYARGSRLFKATWMINDQSAANWSFGLRLVQPAGGSRKMQVLESFKVENFSTAPGLNVFPYTPFDPLAKNVGYFYDKQWDSDGSIATPAAKAALKDLLDIANPDVTTFNLGGSFSASCASCHTRDQTEGQVRDATGKTHEELVVTAGTKTWTMAIWPPFRNAIEHRDEKNVHNFSYSGTMGFGVSRRALNETEALRQLVHDFYPAQAAVATPAPIPTLGTPAGADTASNLDFATTIQPLLTARCGYCHSSKREPALLKEPVAKGYACLIVDHVSSDVLTGYAHMPPGKVLPKADIALLTRWAASLGCAPD